MDLPASGPADVVALGILGIAAIIAVGDGCDVISD